MISSTALSGRFASLILSLCIAAMLAPAPALAQTLVEIVSSAQWAVGSSANCGVPKKTYSLSIEGTTIIWRDGLGNVDVESVVTSGPSSFTSVTLQSIHSGPGERVGQNWSYFQLRPGLIRVQPAGKSAFMLAACE